MSYNHKVDDSGLGTPAAIVDNVFELYRKAKHYSIKKQNPTLYKDILKMSEKASLALVKEAYNVYISKEENTVPHPNYFKAVLTNLIKNSNNGKVIWGRSI
jgi:hypothetical protein